MVFTQIQKNAALGEKRDWQSGLRGTYMTVKELVFVQWQQHLRFESFWVSYSTF
jgi:hypothetical protein